MKLIAAVDDNWAIGYKNKLLVSIPEDMKNLRTLTTGNVVVMGRRTLESFPNGLPLRDRTNIVLTANPNYEVRNAIVVHDLDELREVLKDYESDKIYVIGGGSVYKMLEPYCQDAIITKINYKYQADTYFPNLDEKDNWKLVGSSEEKTCFSIEYHFLEYHNESSLEL